MSRSLRRLQRKPDALQAMKNLGNLTKTLADTQNSLGNLVKVVQGAESGSGADETRRLVDALVEDVAALAKENEVQRETFLRLLIALSEDSEENIRKVEATVREEVLKERA